MHTCWEKRHFSVCTGVVTFCRVGIRRCRFGNLRFGGWRLDPWRLDACRFKMQIASLLPSLSSHNVAGAKHLYQLGMALRRLCGPVSNQSIKMLLSSGTKRFHCRKRPAPLSPSMTRVLPLSRTPLPHGLLHTTFQSPDVCLPRDAERRYPRGV